MQGILKILILIIQNLSCLAIFCNPKDLISANDKSNITILPSYTEGYPYVVDEMLFKKYLVIIFDEISYVVNNKKGIFISKRDEINSKGNN